MGCVPFRLPISWQVSLTIAIRINLDHSWITEFCNRWLITEFALFGSVLGDNFRGDSDVDVLVTFEDDAPWSLWDLVTMQDELEAKFGRKVDLVEKKAIKNPFRRHHILTNYEVVHAA